MKKKHYSTITNCKKEGSGDHLFLRFLHFYILIYLNILIMTPPSYFKICLKEIDRTGAFKKLSSALLFNLQLERTKEHFLRSCFLIIFHRKKKY